MSKPGSQRRTSLQLNDGLMEIENNSNNPSQSIDKIGVSQTSIHRKGGLKPEAERMFSEKKIANQNKVPTTKSIKSIKSIQFKNSNEFERFTYVKQGEISKLPPSLMGNGRPNINDGQCCAIM